jgi:hypothetical protein
MERMARKVTRDRPLEVEFVDDPALIHANELDWTTFAAWVPSEGGLPVRAPEYSKDVVAIAREMGGGPAIWQHLLIRFTARQPCVIEQFNVVAERSSLLTGANVLICPTGGADALARQIRIRFAEGDLESVHWFDGAKSRPLAQLRVKLAPGEIEELLFDVSGTTADFKWWLLMTVSTEGRRVVVRVPEDGDFTYRSGQGLARYMSNSGKWASPEDPTAS